MTRSELVTLTGFEPMPDEYQEIEQAYYHFDGSTEDRESDLKSHRIYDNLKSNKRLSKIR